MVCLEPFAPKIWLAKVRLFRRNSKQREDVNFTGTSGETCFKQKSAFTLWQRRFRMIWQLAKAGSRGSSW
jgi:hypothetical protein